MKIFQCSPFFNEHLILNISSKENMRNIDELHITELNITFQGKTKAMNYQPDTAKKENNIAYHEFNLKKRSMRTGMLGKILLIPYRFHPNNYKRTLLAHPSWYHEAVLRNKASSYILPEDNDIIILCDIDEIVDNRYFDRLVEETKKYGIVTCKLHFTLFYFNLFSLNFAGPPGYSYRLFSMTGRNFKNLKMTSDQLRKMGEWNKLKNEIYCIDEYLGFHHSWLGDAEYVKNKMNSYAHTIEHKGKNSLEFIQQCLKKGESLFDGHQLEVNNEIPLLKTVEKEKHCYQNYFIKGL